jgi:hypothetical protein
MASALRRGHQVTLAQGAHATYDDGETPADSISRQVEEELGVAGAAVIDARDIIFS